MPYPDPDPDPDSDPDPDPDPDSDLRDSYSSLIDIDTLGAFPDFP